MLGFNANTSTCMHQHDGINRRLHTAKTPQQPYKQMCVTDLSDNYTGLYNLRLHQPYLDHQRNQHKVRSISAAVMPNMGLLPCA
jgi:hypothetical protein